MIKKKKSLNQWKDHLQPSTVKPLCQDTPKVDLPIERNTCHHRVEYRMRPENLGGFFLMESKEAFGLKSGSLSMLFCSSCVYQQKTKFAEGPA
jgi:hypothetical protein